MTGAGPLPAPEDVGAISPGGRDMPRIAWWGIRASLARNPIVRALEVVLLLLVGFAVGVGPLPRAAALLLVIPAALLLAFLAGWLITVVRASSRRSAVYLSRERDAVIILVARADRRSWELTGHVARCVGAGAGASFRAALADPLRAAATEAAVGIEGRAATRGLQARYVAQFSSWGLVAEGRHHVRWSPPQE